MSHTIGSSRSTSTTAAGPDSMGHVNSPLPYLVGGLAFMLAVIAMALIILAWSYEDEDEDEEHKPARKVDGDGFEPRVVIIMPGHLYPTHLAKPRLVSVSSSIADLNDKFDDDHAPHGDEHV